MTRNNFSSLCPRTIGAWLKLITVVLSSVVFASSAEISAANNAKRKALFQAKCGTCHGQDGAGSALGKRIQVADLRSSEVQSQSDADLSRIISDGRKDMPPFGSALSKSEIDSLVAYIRGFRAAK
jgi:cytochrome c6